MKKISLLFLITFFLISSFTIVFADRNTATITTYNSSQLIKRGDAKIYSITFVATSSNGFFVIQDALSQTLGMTDTKAEGAEATSGNSQFQNFVDKPLEFSTGLYLCISNGYVILRYE